MNDVILREPTDDDIPVFFEHQRDPIACHMVPFVSRDPNDEPAFTTHWTTILTDDTVTKRTVLCGDQIAGYIVSFVRDEKLEAGWPMSSDMGETMIIAASIPRSANSNTRRSSPPPRLKPRATRRIVR